MNKKLRILLIIILLINIINVIDVIDYSGHGYCSQNNETTETANMAVDDNSLNKIYDKAISVVTWQANLFSIIFAALIGILAIVTPVLQYLGYIRLKGHLKPMLDKLKEEYEKELKGFSQEIENSKKILSNVNNMMLVGTENIYNANLFMCEIIGSLPKLGFSNFSLIAKQSQEQLSKLMVHLAIITIQIGDDAKAKSVIDIIRNRGEIVHLEILRKATSREELHKETISEIQKAIKEIEERNYGSSPT